MLGGVRVIRGSLRFHPFRLNNPTETSMKTYVISRRSGWSSLHELEKAAARGALIGEDEMPDRINWIRSYVTKEEGDRFGTVCIYQAVDDDAVREHARRADLPCDDCVEVTDVVIVNPDPDKALNPLAI